MNYYTSDWHLGESIGQGKPNLRYRPFDSVEHQDNTIINNLNKQVSDKDTLYHLGDVCVGEDSVHLLEKLPKCKKILILGNYDDKRRDVFKYFDEVHFSLELTIEDDSVLLNHYPTSCRFILDTKNIYDYALTGHVHGLWKVQPSIINVGVDAWHFRPVSEEEIKFCINAMRNHYDNDVFLPHISDKK